MGKKFHVELTEHYKGTKHIRDVEAGDIYLAFDKFLMKEFGQRAFFHPDSWYSGNRDGTAHYGQVFRTMRGNHFEAVCATSYCQVYITELER